MRIAILYATKTGTAAKAAQKLAEQFTARGDEATVTNLAEGRPDLAAADAVALYACRCGSDDVRQMLGKQIGEPLVTHAVFVDGVGGELNLEAQKGFDRFVVRQILKSGKAGEMKASGLQDDRLNALADALAKATAQ